MFGIGTWELMVVMAVCFLLFGNRLPSLMRSMGRSVTEFKHGLQDPSVEEEMTTK